MLTARDCHANLWFARNDTEMCFLSLRGAERRSNLYFFNNSTVPNYSLNQMRSYLHTQNGKVENFLLLFSHRVTITESWKSRTFFNQSRMSALLRGMSFLFTCGRFRNAMENQNTIFTFSFLLSLVRLILIPCFPDILLPDNLIFWFSLYLCVLSVLCGFNICVYSWLPSLWL